MAPFAATGRLQPMGNQPFNVIVILFWLATMSWLVVAKILPPLRVGEPPNYAAILEDSSDQPPACWTIRMQGRTIGWAANKLVHGENGIGEFYSRVYLSALPLDELAPGWLTSVLEGMLSNLRELDIDKRSRFAVDPLGRLTEFDSRVRLADAVDAIHVHGEVEGSTVNLAVTSGDITARVTRSLASNALMGDELSPQSRMPGLRVGQKWTVPLYSPFRTSSSPLEILEAIVEREERFLWDGQTINTRVVVYRGDPGAGLSGQRARGRMWVRDDGVVVRQEVSVFKSLVRFERLPASAAEPIWQALGEDWNRALPAALARQLLVQLGGAAPGELRDHRVPQSATVP